MKTLTANYVRITKVDCTGADIPTRYYVELMIDNYSLRDSVEQVYSLKRAEEVGQLWANALKIDLVMVVAP